MSYVCMYLNIFNSQLKFRCQTTDSSNQLELRTYTKVVPFKEKTFLSLCSIGENIEWNGIKIGD